MISLIFLSLAAICNAIMDTLQFHFYDSIFEKDIKTSSKWNQYWNPNISWRNKYINGEVAWGRKKILNIINYPVFLTDGWHLFKSLMLSFLFLSIFTFNIKLDYWYYLPVLFIVYKTVWGMIFELFYKHILIRK